MDPFSYAMALMAAQSVQRQFEEIEPHRRSISEARATRRGCRLRNLVTRVTSRQDAATATEHV
jgi:hypothetical protein